MLVILNRSAGTAALQRDAIGDAVRQQFASHGIEAEILHPDEQTSLTTLAKQAADGIHQQVVAGGGDGTISAVAGALAGTGKSLGVLPLGTLNHFAKDLRLPLDLPSAVETIVRGRVREVDVAEVNGRTFINNSSLGLYPRIVVDRKQQQQRLARGKWTAFIWATLRAFRRFPFLSLEVDVQGQRLARRTAFLFVGNNEYQFSGFNFGGRERLDAGKLGLYLTHRTGRLGLFRLAAHALLGRLNQARDFDVFLVEEAIIESRHARLLVATDGEVTWLDTPLHYRVRPRALRVFVPNDQS
jgi:diacylglycerol kinase family enzyme